MNLFGGLWDITTMCLTDYHVLIADLKLAGTKERIAGFGEHGRIDPKLIPPYTTSSGYNRY